MVELVDRNIKIIITVYHMYKNLEERLKKLIGYMGDNF